MYIYIYVYIYIDIFYDIIYDIIYDINKYSMYTLQTLIDYEYRNNRHASHTHI